MFYLVCCGPLARILSLPPRSPERPYLCYDCDAILGFNQLAADECLKVHWIDRWLPAGASGGSVPAGHLREILQQSDFGISVFLSTYNNFTTRVPGLCNRCFLVTGLVPRFTTWWLGSFSSSPAGTPLAR